MVSAINTNVNNEYNYDADDEAEDDDDGEQKNKEENNVETISEFIDRLVTDGTQTAPATNVKQSQPSRIRKFFERLFCGCITKNKET